MDTGFDADQRAMNLLINDLDKLTSPEPSSFPTLPAETRPRTSRRVLSRRPNMDAIPRDEPAHPSIMDPLTDLPYERVDERLLEMMTRANCRFCFHSIPGTIYFLSRLATSLPQMRGLNFNLNIECGERDSNQDQHFQTQLATYTRLYTRWLMTETPKRNIAIVNAEGSVALSPLAQSAIFILRCAVRQLKDGDRSWTTFKDVHSGRLSSPSFNWQCVIDTEPKEVFSYLWPGILPVPCRFMPTRDSHQLTLPSQPDRVAMTQPYSSTYHQELQQQQQQHTHTSPQHVPGQAYIWRPETNVWRNRALWAPRNNHIILNQIQTDPFILETDKAVVRQFAEFMHGQNSAHAGTPEDLRARHDFWRAFGGKIDWSAPAGNTAIAAHLRASVTSWFEAAPRRTIAPSRTMQRRGRPSLIVKLKVAPSLAVQRLGKMRGGRASSHSYTNALAQGGVRGLSSAAVINSIGSVNGVKIDAVAGSSINIGTQVSRNAPTVLSAGMAEAPRRAPVAQMTPSVLPPAPMPPPPFPSAVASTIPSGGRGTTQTGRNSPSSIIIDPVTGFGRRSSMASSSFSIPGTPTSFTPGAARPTMTRPHFRQFPTVHNTAVDTATRFNTPRTATNPNMMQAPLSDEESPRTGWDQSSYEELERRHQQTLERAHSAARQDISWDIATTVSERYGRDYVELAVQRLGAYVLCSCSAPSFLSASANPSSGRGPGALADGTVERRERIGRCRCEGRLVG